MADATLTSRMDTFLTEGTLSSGDKTTIRGLIGAGTSSTTGTVTSVAVSVPTGLSISGTPVTTAGTLAITLASGYNFLTDAEQTKLGYITVTGSVDLDDLVTNAVLSGSPADHSWAGFAIDHFNAGETLGQFETVYMDPTDGEWKQADADAVGEAPAGGLTLEAGTDGNPIKVLIWGFVRDDSWTWTVDGELFLSDTAGGITQTAPSTAADVVQPIGRALHADYAYFDFNQGWAEVA